MLLSSQIEEKEEIRNKKEDNNTKRKEPKGINHAENMNTVKGHEIIGGKREKEIRKLKIQGETQRETKDQEDSLLLKVMQLAQQASFQMSLLMTFW